MKQFHPFRLDTVNHRLWRGEDRLSLSPKAFDVLRYLVEHADRLVTQDELLEALWPETYVNPEIIKKYILGIRRVLGDRHDRPAFIETFPRRGYQFIAPVSDVRTEMEAPGDSGSDAAWRIVGRGTVLDQLGGYLGQVLRAQRPVAFTTGDAKAGKPAFCDKSAQRTPPMTAILIFFGTDGVVRMRA